MEKLTAAEITRRFQALGHMHEWLTLPEATAVSGMSNQTLADLAAPSGLYAEGVRRIVSRHTQYHRGWLFQKLCEVHGIGWKDVVWLPDVQDAARRMALRCWSELQETIDELGADVVPIPPEASIAKGPYDLSADRPPPRNRAAPPPLQDLTCQTCGEIYQGHPGASTECRRCRSHTAFRKRLAEASARRHGTPPPGQQFTSPTPA